MLTTEITLILGKFTLELAATSAESDNLSYKKNRLGVTKMKFGFIAVASLLLISAAAPVWPDTEMKVATNQSGAFITHLYACGFVVCQIIVVTAAFKETVNFQ